MKNWKRILIGIVISLAAFIIVFALLSILMLRRSLPEYSGERNLKGLEKEVKIYRDDWGIPMIVADYDEDAAFALGYVHAQERLFQMDIARRAGAGRLSEVFGSSTVPIDKMFRTIGIYNVCRESIVRLNAASQKILIAYSKGVNAYIKDTEGNYAVEFDVLGYDPYPWKPEHSLVIAKLMGWELNISWWTDLMFSHLVQKLGGEKARELLPNYPENAPTIIPSSLNSTASVNFDLIQVDRAYRELIGFKGTHIGSNNWVVNGNKSVSGKPIIANDPHLAYTAPGRWYFTIIRSNNWNVEGFTIAGLPAVVIGKNSNIAWAMTNVMADDSDFFSEQLDSSSTKYLSDGNWKNLSIIHDTIKVKNSESIPIEIKKTHRGPIISDIHPLKKIYPKIPDNNARVSFRWTGLEFSDELYAALQLNKAKNWYDFQSALANFTLPGQNFVYADVNGNIGYVCAARLPIRQNTSPTFLTDGSISSNDWKGFVPYSEMPKLFNPDQNFIASANNKTVQNFPFHISNIWEPSSRIERITELLNSKEKHSLRDFQKYQMDFISPYARRITSHILNSFHDVKVNDKNLNTTLELFKNWDFEMNMKSQIPTIYSFFLKNLLWNVLADELGDDLFKEYLFIANVPYRKLLEILESYSSLWDDVNTSAVESREDIIRKSLIDALSELEKRYGSNPAYWQWGDIHRVTFKHMFHGKSFLLDRLIDIGSYNIGGDGTTLFNTEYSFPELYEKDHDSNLPNRSKFFENKLGPSMRYIFDFANPNIMHVVLTSGQSGHFMSDQYNDMTNLWLKGKYIDVPLDKSEFIKKSKHQLSLQPE